MTDTVLLPRPASRPLRMTGGALILAVLTFALLGPLAIPGDPFAQVLLKALSGPEPGAPLRAWRGWCSARSLPPAAAGPTGC